MTIKKETIQRLQELTERLATGENCIPSIRNLLFDAAAQDGFNAAEICYRLAPINRPLRDWQLDALRGLPNILEAHRSWETGLTWINIEIGNREKRERLEQDLDI